MNEDKLTIKIGDSDRELFMSFGLLNALSQIVGDPSKVSMISLDPDTRSKVLTATLAKRKASGKVIEDIPDIDDIDASIIDIEKVLEWVSGHVMAFFVRSVQRAVDVT